MAQNSFSTEGGLERNTRVIVRQINSARDLKSENPKQIWRPARDFALFILSSLIARRPIKANALLSERLLLNWSFKTENNAFKQVLGGKKIQPVSIVASDNFVNRRED